MLLSREVVDGAAVAFTAAGLVILVTARPRQWGDALRLALEFWTAAGLVRLSGSPTWHTIALAAGVVAVRKLAGASFARAGSNAHRVT